MNKVSKSGKELMVKNYDNYRVSSGTVDNKNPKAIYVSISAWGESLSSEDINYNGVIRNLTKKIKLSLYDNLDSNLFFKDKCIVDFDMRESGISYGKRTYMNCEITFFQKHLFKIQEKEIQNSIVSVLNKITTEVLDDCEYFKFFSSKK